MTEAFTLNLKRVGGNKAQKLQTYSGKEFYNQLFETLGDANACIEERFNRTLKNEIVSLLYGSKHVEVFRCVT